MWANSFHLQSSGTSLWPYSHQCCYPAWEYSRVGPTLDAHCDELGRRSPFNINQNLVCRPSQSPALDLPTAKTSQTLWWDPALGNDSQECLEGVYRSCSNLPHPSGHPQSSQYGCGDHDACALDPTTFWGVLYHCDHGHWCESCTRRDRDADGNHYAWAFATWESTHDTGPGWTLPSTRSPHGLPSMVWCAPIAHWPAVSSPRWPAHPHTHASTPEISGFLTRTSSSQTASPTGRFWLPWPRHSWWGRAPNNWCGGSSSVAFPEAISQFSASLSHFWSVGHALFPPAIWPPRNRASSHCSGVDADMVGSQQGRQSPSYLLWWILPQDAGRRPLPGRCGCGCLSSYWRWMGLCWCPKQRSTANAELLHSRTCCGTSSAQICLWPHQDSCGHSCLYTGSVVLLWCADHWSSSSRRLEQRLAPHFWTLLARHGPPSC